MRRSEKQGRKEEENRTTALKYLGEKYGIDKGRFRVRLTYADGSTAYKRFETELQAKAFMGKVVARWEGRDRQDNDKAR